MRKKVSARGIGEFQFNEFYESGQFSLNMHKIKLVLVVCSVAIASCASTGVVPMDKGLYLIAKKSPQVGFGPPIGVKGEVYTEANEFCAKDGKVVETVKLSETDSGFARAAAVSLEFRCVEK